MRIFYTDVPDQVTIVPQPEATAAYHLAGGDVRRAGTRTSASGSVTSKTGKKAIGEALDSQIADMKRDEKKTTKGKDKPTGATPKAKAKAKAETSETKKLQKEIKLFLT